MTNSSSLFYYPQISSTFMVVAPKFSGSISTVSSALIIFIIFKSRSRISTVYHRIMIGMSCADILASVAMALTTLPMPRGDLSQDLLDRGYEYPPYAGIKLGNMQTCTAQGFFFIFGVYTMFGYNLSLCYYNTCTIALRMQETTIVKYVEPVLHLLPLATSMGIALPLAFGNHYRPTGYEMWCSIRVIDNNHIWFDQKFVLFLDITFFALIILCGVMMVGRVYHIEKGLVNARQSPNYERAANSLKNTKVLISQMALYTLSYILTLLPTLVLHIVPPETDTTVLFCLQQILLPLQGFFNALIFIHHKIYNYRRSNDVSRCYVLKKLLSGNHMDAIIFSRISMITYDRNREIMEMQVEDENGPVEIICIKEESLNSGADVFYDSVDGDQDLSGFSQPPPSAAQSGERSSIGASKGGLSGFSSELPSNENEQSLNDESGNNSVNMNDSRLSYSKGSNSIFSWISRANKADMSTGGLSGIPSVSEENV